MNTKERWLRFAALAALILLLVGACAPGNARWLPETGNRANFWAGLWHGLIIVVTFIISLFTRDVRIYEVNNVGWGYNLGFLLGAMMALGGGARSACRGKRREPNWDSVGERIAREVRSHVRDELKQAAGSGQQSSDAEWDEFSRRVEDRIRSEFRKKWND
jgi:hypothetical protein